MQCSLAPSAFLASAAASSDLVHHIVPPTLQGSPIPHVDVAWPEGETRCSQKAWDTIKATAMADHLLSDVSDPRSRARLHASFQSKGVWCLPISSLGLRMDDNTIRVAIDLRLGVQLCRPHTCHHCGG